MARRSRTSTRNLAAIDDTVCRKDGTVPPGPQAGPRESTEEHGVPAAETGVRVWQMPERTVMFRHRIPSHPPPFVCSFDRTRSPLSFRAVTTCHAGRTDDHRVSANTVSTYVSDRRIKLSYISHKMLLGVHTVTNNSTKVRNEHPIFSPRRLLDWCLRGSPPGFEIGLYESPLLDFGVVGCCIKTV